MAEHYPPVKSLLASGLIAERRGRWSTTYVVTDKRPRRPFPLNHWL